MLKSIYIIETFFDNDIKIDFLTYDCLKYCHLIIL